jgi:hypothetical protein
MSPNQLLKVKQGPYSAEIVKVIMFVDCSLCVTGSGERLVQLLRTSESLFLLRANAGFAPLFKAFENCTDDQVRIRRTNTIFQ